MGRDLCLLVCFFLVVPGFSLGCGRLGYNALSSVGTASVVPLGAGGAPDIMAGDAGNPTDTDAAMPTPPPPLPCSQITAADTDGDGIPDYRDPDPATCNLTTFVELFNPRDTRWAPVGSWTEAPGAWTGDSANALIDLNLAYTPFIETTFIFGAISTPAEWSVGIELTTPTDIGACNALVSQAIDTMYGGTGPRVRVGAETPMGGWGSFPTATYDFSPGKRYTLQLRSAASQIQCFLFDETKQVSSATSPNGFPMPTSAGSVHIITTGRQTTFESIRATN